MNQQILHTDGAPAAIGPYSQAVRAGDTIYVSGQLPINPTTGDFAGGDIQSQTRQSIANIQAILKSEGIGLKNVVKTTVYLNDMKEFAAMNEIYAEYFTEKYPARIAVQAACLPKNALVEIDAIAVL